ncbi:RNA-directed DNA polymerase, eukaryota, reverse transcriptase zinc-binding domain protein [Tanacetum coccineum]
MSSITKPKHLCGVFTQTQTHPVGVKPKPDAPLGSGRGGGWCGADVGQQLKGRGAAAVAVSGWMRNPELGILKKLDRVMGNSQLISVYPASYANFMPYLSSDHCPTVIIILDVVRSKPRSFRVQESLDRDPSCSRLREEEMIYVQAYKDASIDEEKLLRQKTKVEWLKDGDSNTSYFHNVIKGRVSKSRIKVIYNDLGDAFYGNDVAKEFVSHFRNFLSTCDNVFDIEDPGSLFTKKLEVDKAVEMIKHVSNEEIKGALFSIRDNKSSGPEGYTSSGRILGELNYTLISLVPKVSSPAKITDYRPISCCNVVYKTISKVITNRIKLVLGDLVDLNQSASIPERLISDNILLAHEFMKWYNWDIGVRNYAFKIVLIPFLQILD